MELLQQVVKTGFNIAENLAKDTNFDALRDRADFRLLLESRSKPKPKQSGPTPRPLNSPRHRAL